MLKNGKTYFTKQNILLRCSHCKIFKYVWPFMHERVKEIVSSNKKSKIGNMKKGFRRKKDSQNYYCL